MDIKHCKKLVNLDIQAWTLLILINVDINPT